MIEEIRELKEKKRDLQREIEDLLKQFTVETGLTIHTVETSSISNTVLSPVKGEIDQLFKVDIEIII